LKDKVRACYGIEDFFLRHAPFTINNGYLLQFGEEIET